MKTGDELIEELNKRVMQLAADDTDKTSIIVDCDWINCLKWVLEE